MKTMRALLVIISILSLFFLLSAIKIMKVRMYENQISECKERIEAQSETIIKNVYAMTEHISRYNQALANKILSVALINLDDVSTVLHSNRREMDRYEEDETLQNFLIVFNIFEQYKINTVRRMLALECERNKYMSKPINKLILYIWGQI